MAEIKKTLGGERLGGENKMEVELHGFNRSSHDISMLFKTDQAAGPIVPCFVDIATDGTDYYFDLASKIRTLPTNGPVFGAMKHQIDIFKIPIRLYNAQLHNNALGIGLKMSQVKLPLVNYIVQKVPAGTGNKYQVAQDSLTAYLGIRGFGTKMTTAQVRRSFPAIFELAYWDIYKNYYANKQEEIGAVISGVKSGVNNVSIRNISATNYKTGGQSQTTQFNQSNQWKQTQNFELQTQAGLTPSTIVIQLSSYLETEKIEQIKLYNEKKETYTTISELQQDYKFQRSIASGNQTIYLSLTNATTSEKYTIPANTPIIENAIIEQGETEFSIQTFELENIDEMREKILKAPKEIPFEINVTGGELKLPYTATCGVTQTENPEEATGNGCYFSQAGLGLKTYLSDRFNNWLSTEWIDGVGGINEITAVKVEDGTITMDALLLQKKLYYMMNRIAISGGSYNDWREAVYGQRTIQLPESPIYEGGMAAEILFDEVVSTADATTADGEAQPLGTLAGRGSSDNRTRGGKNIHVHIDEPSIIMILESITPRIDYSQGNKWFTALETLDDLHKPNLDGIGFQELITEEMAAFDTQVGVGGVPTKFSAGKQPSWIQYQTNQNATFGDFSANNPLDFMAFNRVYEQDEETNRIKDLTTYIDPTMYNKAFAVQDLKSKNFWVQVAINCTVRRVMSAKQIPNL